MQRSKCVKEEEHEQIVEIALERLRDFRNHPFKVKDNQQMRQLKESVERYGILNPLIVRPNKEGYYEIIAGHRRREAARCLGFTKVPVIIRVLTDDEAIVAMVDSNVQRELISPSEKAFAYKMKYDVLKRQKGDRPRNGQIDHIIPKGKNTVQFIGEEVGDSAKQVQRYLKITNLIPELLDKLDNGIISFNPAVDIAYLKEEEQRMVLDAMEYTQAVPSISQAQRIKKLSQERKVTQDKIVEILSEIKKGEVTRVMFRNEPLYKYFPRSYTPAQMKREIIAILKTYTEQSWKN